MSFLKWVIGLPLVVLTIAFAVANDARVSFAWSPLHDPLSWPLYALVLAALVIGFILGSLMTWAAGHPVRRDRREYRRLNKKLQGELDKAQTQISHSDTLHTARRALTDEEAY